MAESESIKFVVEPVSKTLSKWHLKKNKILLINEIRKNFYVNKEKTCAEGYSIEYPIKSKDSLSMYFYDISRY